MSKDVSGAEPIEKWEALLGEIAPEAYNVRHRISPSVLAGHGFLWSTRTAALLYNPGLISEKELPRTWKEMGDPKYRGAFSRCHPKYPWRFWAFEVRARRVARNRAILGQE